MRQASSRVRPAEERVLEAVGLEELAAAYFWYSQLGNGLGEVVQGEARLLGMRRLACRLLRRLVRRLVRR